MTQPSLPKSYILSELKEVALPSPVSWWPQTIGWKILAVLVFLLVLWAAYNAFSRWWQNRYRREALSVVSALDTAHLQFEYQLFVIAKKVLSYLNPHHHALFGEAFVAKLNVYSPQSPIDQVLANDWLQALTCEKSRMSADKRAQLQRYFLQWIRLHQVEAPSGDQGGGEQ